MVRKKVLMLGAAMAAMNCLAESSGNLGMFLYDYKNGCVRWGSVAFLVCLAVAIRWAYKHDKKKRMVRTSRGDGDALPEVAVMPTSAKTFSNAPMVVRTIAVLVVLERVVGFILFPCAGSGGALIVGILIAKAVVGGAAGARIFLFAIGMIAVAVGALMLPHAVISEKGTLVNVLLILGSGIFNLLMGVVLFAPSADKWFKRKV